MGEQLGAVLQDRFGQHPNVGDIRGRGLFWAIEFVADRNTLEPFPADEQRHAHLKSTAMEHGLMCYPMGGCVDGRSGDHVLLAPPYIVTANDIDEITQRLDHAIQDVF